MKPRLEDPVFGRLTFNSAIGGMDSWSKQEHLELIGGYISLNIHADSNGPTEEQRQVYLAFKQAESGLKAELQEALFDFYQVEREVYADIYADICDDPSLNLHEEDFVPVLQNSDQIWGIIDPLEWLIVGHETGVGQLDEGGGKCDTMLFWHGCWDVEHEFGALFRNAKLLRVAGPGNF